MLVSTGKKKKTQPKSFQLSFIRGPYEDYSPGETASQIALRDCSEEVREEPRYIGVFAEKEQKTNKKTPGSQSKDYCSHKQTNKNQASQVKDFSAFLYMGYGLW